MTPTALEPILELPSGGDCSYPGLYWHDDLLHVTFYSSHEGKAAIYYASALSSAAPATASFTLLTGMLLTVIVIASVWFATVVYVLSTPRAAAAFKRFKVYFESFFGVSLASFGLRQIAARFL